MKRFFLSMVLVAAFLLVGNTATAYNLLQLDIVDGAGYNTGTETIVSGDTDFDLIALLNTDSGLFKKLSDPLPEFYMVASVEPMPGVTDYGSFTFEGETVDVTGGMIPISSDALLSDPVLNHGELGSLAKLFSFSFDDGNKTTAYNTQDNPGGFGGLDPTGTFLFHQFDVNTENLSPFVPIHFDLFVLDKHDKMITAPFSHDATAAAPEPGTMLLLGTGLVALAGMGREKFRGKTRG